MHGWMYVHGVCMDICVCMYVPRLTGWLECGTITLIATLRGLVMPCNA